MEAAGSGAGAHLSTVAVQDHDHPAGTTSTLTFCAVAGRGTIGQSRRPGTRVISSGEDAIVVQSVLWVCGRLRGRPTLLAVGATGMILLLTHTRTALVAMTAGLLIAGLSLIAGNARVRKLFAVGGAVVAVAIMTLSSVIVTFLARGQGTEQLTNLTGRTVVWSALVNFPRDKFQMLFGFGLSNDSFNGLAIDSNWLASYQGQGLIGVGICAAMLVFLLVSAYFQPRGVQRALALFLITYCLVGSFTEVGITNVTPYLLELVLAASLLVPSTGRRPT